MTLGFGLLGALVFLLPTLLIPLHFSVRIRYPGVSESEVRMFGWTLSRWTSLEAAGAAGASSTAQGAGPRGNGPSPLRDLEAFAALLKPLRFAPVSDLRIAAKGGAGDPAATALLYGAAWSALGTFLAVRGLRPREIRLEPLLQGPAEFRASGEAELRVTLWSLLLGGVQALRVLRA